MRAFTPPSVLPRILLVECHDRMRRMQVRFLSRTFAVDFASTGDEALAMARTRTYAAVVADVARGDDLGGPDLLRALRALPLHRSTPVIAVTGPLSPDDGHALIGAGFSFHVARPFRWDSLLDVVRHAVGGSVPVRLPSGDGAPLGPAGSAFGLPLAVPAGTPGPPDALPRWRPLADL